MPDNLRSIYITADVIPTNVSKKNYIAIPTYNLGHAAFYWKYNNVKYFGQMHWINFATVRIFPEYINPDGYLIHPVKGVHMNVMPDYVDRAAEIGVVVGATAINPSAGLGAALALQYLDP